MRNRIIYPLAALMASIFPTLLFAAGSGMPWEGPLSQIENSITGPWLRFGTIVAIIGVGLAIAFSETGGLLKKGLMVVLGLSVACAAVSWGVTFFGFAGAIGI